MRGVMERGTLGTPTPELLRGTAGTSTPPSPLEGEGWGEGVRGTDWGVSTPHPSPPPQGGRG